MMKLKILLLSVLICSCGGSNNKIATVSQSHYEKGIAALAKKDLLTAEKELKAAIDKNGKHIEARTALGDVYLEWRRHREAENHYRNALNIDANNDAPYIGLAKLYLDGDDLKEASVNITNALKISADNDESHYIIGLIYLKKNKLSAAAGAFRNALEINPGHASAQARLKQAMEKQETAGSPAPDMNKKSKVTRADIAHLLIAELKLADIPVETSLKIRDIRGHRYQKEIQKTVNLGILKLVDGYFHPEQYATRADLGAVGQELIIMETGDVSLKTAFQNTTSPFDDVTNGHPDYNAMLLSASYGLIEALSDGKFHPEREVTGVEVVSLFQKVRQILHVR